MRWQIAFGVLDGQAGRGQVAVDGVSNHVNFVRVPAKNLPDCLLPVRTGAMNR